MPFGLSSSNAPFKENPILNGNHRIRYALVGESTATLAVFTYDVTYNIRVNAGNYACLIEIPCTEYKNQSPTGNTYNQYVMIGAKNTGDLFSEFSNGVTVIGGKRAYRSTIFKNTQAATITDDNFKSISLSTTTDQSTAMTSYTNYLRPSVSLTALMNALGNVPNMVYTKVQDNTFTCGCIGYANKDSWYSYNHCVQYLSLGLPVFKYDNVTGIINYLTTGDEGGAIDPFDPNNPTTVTVTNFNTNFDAYVTLGDPAQPYTGFTNIHWSVRALNEQYNEARDILAGMYSLDVVTAGYPWEYFKRTQAQVPVASFTKATPNNSESYNPFQFFFTEYGTQDGTQNQHSGIFLIDYAYKEGSRSKCKIRQVKFKTGDPFTTAWQTEGVELSRVAIGTDAYKYTASTGETLTIYFRGITLEDLNKTDDGYKENPDTEASPTEGDVVVVSGSGLNTFSISKAQFNLINKALWSTDWTQVFKSTTIDPIKCVITCKGIKFANAGSGDVPIIIANRDTDVSSGVVNPVKSYTIDNCYIPAINGDFTDISLMRVRCYLPYIGWVDLPSAEVVGRLAYNGVQAVNKRLTFKYIVDFIDGACRCVVSVNGTERWMFDGNCAVDIPVTSDNHTNAIGTAIKSGLATTLSIATGVAGAISGNAGAVAGGVVGAINSAPNMLPTYEYSASASPSGYVNGSCNSHIMIVCEIPNVQTPNGFSRKVGRPCERNLSLGSLVGFTQCKNVNVSGINATTEELTMIAQELNSGVYL